MVKNLPGQSGTLWMFSHTHKILTVFLCFSSASFLVSNQDKIFREFVSTFSDVILSIPTLESFDIPYGYFKTNIFGELPNKATTPLDPDQDQTEIGPRIAPSSSVTNARKNAKSTNKQKNKKQFKTLGYSEKITLTKMNEKKKSSRTEPDAKKEKDLYQQLNSTPSIALPGDKRKSYLSTGDSTNLKKTTSEKSKKVTSKDEKQEKATTEKKPTKNLSVKPKKQIRENNTDM